MIEFVLFGVGCIGKIYVVNFVCQLGVKLIYVIDWYVLLVEVFVCMYGVQVVDVECVFGDVLVQVVVIVLSIDMYVDFIVVVVNVGKVVFCEKLVDFIVECLCVCVDVVWCVGVICMIGFQCCFDLIFVVLKVCVECGEIGVLEMLVVMSCDLGVLFVDYICSLGGIFKDMLIYDFDVFCWIFGDEVQMLYVMGSCLIDLVVYDVGDIDLIVVMICMWCGLLCQINMLWCVVYGYDQCFELFGS